MSSSIINNCCCCNISNVANCQKQQPEVDYNQAVCHLYLFDQQNSVKFYKYFPLLEKQAYKQPHVRHHLTVAFDLIKTSPLLVSRVIENQCTTDILHLLVIQHLDYF